MRALKLVTYEKELYEELQSTFNEQFVDLPDFMAIAKQRLNFYRVENHLLSLKDSQLMSLLEVLIGHHLYMASNGMHDRIMNLLAHFQKVNVLTPKQRLAVHTHVVVNCPFFKG
jgi:hypothetical protein